MYPTPRDDESAVRLVAEFCERQGISIATRFSLIPNLSEAMRILVMKGADPRWRRINTCRDDADFLAAGSPVRGAELDRLLLRVLSGSEVPGRHRPSLDWCLRHTVISAAHFARFSARICQAREHGLGWMIPAYREVLIVPRPRVLTAEGQPDIPHDDDGRMAVHWADGSGHYFLHGVHFGPPLYRQVVGGTMNLRQIAEIPDADQRSVALTYLRTSTLLSDSGAELIDNGSRGTRLYRLPLPNRLARDRPDGYGDYDYFIHMHDSSHPEREFIEWVDPQVGRHGDAELCQAHAFGISREQWLSIADEG